MPRSAVPLALLLAVAACGKRAAPADDARPAAAAIDAPATPDLVVRAPTADEEFDHLWRVLGDMNFFRANGYDVVLPAHPAFAAIASGDAPRRAQDRAALAAIFTGEIYAPSAYAPALARLRDVPRVLAAALPTLYRWQRQWGFRVFDRYQVVVTRYGPGGSYDVDAATITMLWTGDGFRGGGGVHTAIHEVVHLGIEAAIVQRFALEHWEKERLVDLLVSQHFAGILGEVTIQPVADRALDTFVTAAAADDLPAAVQRFVRAHPR